MVSAEGGSIDWRPLFDRLISAMKSYRVHDIELGLEYSFVDREVEVRRVFGFNERRVIARGMINVVYGPKGCGKTTFFQVLHHALRAADSGFEVIVVRSEEAWSLREAFIPRTLSGLARYLARSLNLVVDVRGVVRGSADLYTFILLVSGYIASKLRRGRHVVVVLDEIRADSPELRSKLRGFLEKYANTLRDDASRYAREKGGSITAVVLTSDAIATDLMRLVGGKVNWVLIWNLPYEAMVELAKQLQLDIDPKLLWRLTGGNPRALTMIKASGLNTWFEEELLERHLYPLVRRAKELYGDRVWDEIRIAVENPDSFDVKWNLIQLLLENNILVTVGGAAKLSDIRGERWIGRYYAYQMPVYQKALELMADRRSPDVTVRELLETL